MNCARDRIVRHPSAYLGHLGDLDQTHAAVAGNGEALVEAEARDFNTSLLTGLQCKHGRMLSKRTVTIRTSMRGAHLEHSGAGLDTHFHAVHEDIDQVVCGLGRGCRGEQASCTMSECR